MDEYLTVPEALKFLKISRATLYRKIDRGEIQPYTLGDGEKIYFKRSELEALFRPLKRDPKENRLDQPKISEAA